MRTLKVLLLPHTKYELKYLSLRSMQTMPSIGHATFAQVGSGGGYNSAEVEKSSEQGGCPGLSCNVSLASEAAW